MVISNDVIYMVGMYLRYLQDLHFTHYLLNISFKSKKKKDH